MPDPLLHDIGLPLSATCYPYGFPVNIFTNSPAVLDAAGEAWNGFTAEFDREPIVVRILAFACARAGWTFVSDDASWLVPGSADLTVLGKPHQARLRHDAQRLFPELEGYIARARPNGKISIEVPTAEFPEIRTAMRERPRVLVFLRRQEAGAAHLQHLSPRQVWDELTGDGAYATYGDEVGLRHLAERKRLLELPGYCLYYSDLDGAIGQLSHLADGMEKR